MRAFTGVLLAPERCIVIPILKSAHLYDLSSFAAQLCKNDEPFAFNRYDVLASVVVEAVHGSVACLWFLLLWISVRGTLRFETLQDFGR